MDQITEQSPQEMSVELSYAVADAQALAREQVQAAWQLYLDRIREQLEFGWRESLEKIYQERFGEIETRLRERFESVVQERADQIAKERLDPACANVRRETIDNLNSLAHRMRAAESREEIRRTLVDAASAPGLRVAFLLPSEFDANAAPAIAHALEAKETVVSSAMEAEISAPVLERLNGAGPDGRIYVIPLVTANHAVGVLAASAPSGNEVDVAELELLASLAAPHFFDPPAPVVIQPAPPKPGWEDLSRAEQEMHLRAQRYARNQVAQLLLNEIRRVHEGRKNRNLYAVFRNEIEHARNEFQNQFFADTPSMVDYLHLELVRNLAKDDSEALGSNYPGPVRS